MPTEMMHMLCIRLSTLRRALGLSQEAVALRAEISVPTYRRLEQFSHPSRAISTPSVATLVRVLRALDVDQVAFAALERSLAEAVPRALQGVSCERAQESRVASVRPASRPSAPLSESAGGRVRAHSAIVDAQGLSA